MPPTRRLAFGDFVLDRSTQRLLRRDGSAVALTPRLFNALELLAEHPGELLDKDTLVARLWPGLVVEENNLSQVVSALRKVLGDDAHGSHFILTVPRRGFKFIAPVVPVPDDAELPAPVAAAGETVAAGPVPATPVGNRGPTGDAGPAATAQALDGLSRRRTVQAAAAVATLAGLGATAWWFVHRQLPDAPSGAVTLAVLPFKPLVAEARDELLEVGMADSLIARLSLVPGLVVRSTGSVRRYAGPDQDPLRAARELDVAWIIDGSLQRRGDELRATARLLRAADGSAVWSGTFDERLTSVFDVQDTISRRVAHVLEPRLQADPAGSAAAGELGGTRNTDAYQLYLAATRHALLLRGDGLRKAVTLYREAIAIDANYALAWVGLAVTYRRSFIAVDGVPTEIFGAAGTAVDRALAIAPNLAEALVERAYARYWFDYDWPAAEASFRRALALNPNVALAHFGLATMLLNQDRLAEGFDELRIARELDPMSPLINTLEANYLFESGRTDEARARLKRAFDVAPAFWLAHDVQGVMDLAAGRPDAAFAALRRAVELADGGTRATALLGAHLARHGHEDEAREMLKALRDLERVRYVPGTALATIHAGLGETGMALDALERAHRDRDARLVFLKDDPLLEGLRGEPRFTALIKKLRLDQFGRGLSPV